MHGSQRSSFPPVRPIGLHDFRLQVLLAFFIHAGCNPMAWVQMCNYELSIMLLIWNVFVPDAQKYLESDREPVQIKPPSIPFFARIGRMTPKENLVKITLITTAMHCPSTIIVSGIVTLCKALQRRYAGKARNLGFVFIIQHEEPVREDRRPFKISRSSPQAATKMSRSVIYFESCTKKENVWVAFLYPEALGLENEVHQITARA